MQNKLDKLNDTQKLRCKLKKLKLQISVQAIIISPPKYKNNNLTCLMYAKLCF